jgi:hypothetical protein
MVEPIPLLKTGPLASASVSSAAPFHSCEKITQSPRLAIGPLSLPLRTEPTSPRSELHMPAYLCSGGRATTRILVYCPACRGIHYHGAADAQVGQRLRRGIAEHCSARLPLASGYALVLLGWVSSPNAVPKLSLSEVLAASACLARCFAKD